MKRQRGIHFYINILNFDSILLKEESATGKVNHSLHALNTYFSSIESYGKRLYPKSFVVEKITGARLHLYVVDDLIPAFSVVENISAYAYSVAQVISNDIPKYKSLNAFKINVGVAYGSFYEHDFISKGGYQESTTIGYAANYAAKLQALTRASTIGISENIYNRLPAEEQQKYGRILDASIKKYDQSCYYSASLDRIDSPVEITMDDFDAVIERAKQVNLSDIEYSTARTSLNFRDLSVTQCKAIDGIPVFADIRGFTSQFKEDDSNLEEMARKTQAILESMYQISTHNGGIHIQFQGDRELSLFQKQFDDDKCCKDAVIAAMRMIDAVKPYEVHIGVGEDFGKLFATKIGARGEKDNILLGETLITADKMEDANAGEDQIAISKAVYEGLEKEDPELAKQFSKGTGYYYTTVGHEKYLKSRSYAQLRQNTAQNNYTGAWRIE